MQTISSRSWSDLYSNFLLKARRWLIGNRRTNALSKVILDNGDAHFRSSLYFSSRISLVTAEKSARGCLLNACCVFGSRGCNPGGHVVTRFWDSWRGPGCCRIEMMMLASAYFAKLNVQMAESADNPICPCSKVKSLFCFGARIYLAWMT